jgi:hypothetical protein
MTLVTDSPPNDLQAAIYSLVGSTKLNDVNPQAYLPMLARRRMWAVGRVMPNSLKRWQTPATQSMKTCWSGMAVSSIQRFLNGSASIRG